MTDLQRRVASTKSALGHSLSVYSLPDGTAWVNFALPATNTEVLSSWKWPIYRVDKYKARNLDDERRLAAMVPGMQKRVMMEPKWINFMIWDGDKSKGRSAALQELSNGSTLIVRYFLFTGGYSEATFDLSGADKAIADALAITEYLSSGEFPRREAKDSALRNASSTCEQNAVHEDFSQCMARIRACIEAATGDPASYAVCTTR